VLYDQVPQPLNVSHANFILPGQTEFSVIADEGSTVSLVLDNEICSVEISDGTYLMMPVIGHQLGDTLHVTVTKQNHIRYHALAICQLGIGIEEGIQNDLIEIYPNPANRKIHINFKNELDGNITITIADLCSKEIYSSNICLSGNSTKRHSIDVNNIDAGVYILKVGGIDFSFFEKVIVRH